MYLKNERPVGIWEWGFLYKETKETSKDNENDSEYMSTSYPSPTHAGGLIAVNREYFLSLGGYDHGLLVWGGEQVFDIIIGFNIKRAISFQYELSFKVWMCGGRVIWAPCSRVGHVYRVEGFSKNRCF